MVSLEERCFSRTKRFSVATKRSYPLRLKSLSAIAGFFSRTSRLFRKDCASVKQRPSSSGVYGFIASARSSRIAFCCSGVFPCAVLAILFTTRIISPALS